MITYFIYLVKKKMRMPLKNFRDTLVFYGSMYSITNLASPAV